MPRLRNAGNRPGAEQIQGLRHTSPHAVSITTRSSRSDTEPIAPTITGRRDSPDIIGGWAGRPVSAGAALAVSVTVQAVRIHTDHEHGYGFLRGGQVTTVERVAFHTGDTRTVIRMASLFGCAGSGHGCRGEGTGRALTGRCCFSWMRSPAISPNRSATETRPSRQ